MNNKTKWQDYEQVTAYIYHQLGKLNGTKILGYGATCKVEGKSGVRHQFDVLVGVNNDDTEKIGVECKYWDKKINEDIVSVVCSHIDDCDIKLGVIVSVKGFTNDAIKMAKFRGIELVILKDIEKSDFDGLNRILTINFKITATFPSFKMEDIIIKIREHEIKDSNLVPLHAYDNGIQRLFYANGEEEDYFVYINRESNKLVRTRENKSIQEVEKEFLFPEGTFITLDGINKLPLASLTFKLTNIMIDKHEDSFEVSVLDKYKMIFHVLFSGLKYTLNNDGEVELLDNPSIRGF